MTDQELHQNKAKAALSIKKAQGTLAKVMQLVDQDAYCPSIIQQVDAAIGLLASSKKTLLKGHLNHCLGEEIDTQNGKVVAELIQIFDLK